MNLDIRTFVIEQLQDPQFARISVEGKEVVKESLISRAGGMCGPLSMSIEFVLPLVRFRWVALQLLAVSKCRSKSALHKILSSLPSTLDETYARILDRIEDDDRPHVLCILQFICFGACPIWTEEAAMLWLVGDNTGGPTCVDDTPFDSEDIFDFFGGLVSVERQCAISDLTWSFLSESKELSIVQLAHFSVKEYLFSPRAGYWTLSGEASHLAIIQYSTAYYLHAVTVDGMSPLPPAKLWEKHSLAEYCCQYMSNHLNHLTPCDHPTPTSLFQLLHPDSNQIANKFGFLFFQSIYRSWANFNDIPISDNPGPSLALILAARLGLSGVASWLLTFDTVQEQIDTSVSDFDCGPPILEAAAKGHTDVIRLLLENGANINEGGKYDQNVLCVASENGQETVVRMLIEAGACVNNEGSMTPIKVASEKGHKGIVEMLIKAGADVNLGYKPAFYYGLDYGHEDVVRTLILAGADVDWEWEIGTALHAAARYHETGQKAVELLIDAGADVNKLAGEYGTALQAAVAGGRDEPSALEVVRILICAGADVNLVGGEYGTALQAATYRNRPQIVEELIEAGADVNLVGGDYSTALRAAVVSGHYYSEEGSRIAIVQRLIRAGADVNLKGGEDTAPLEAALARSRTEIAQILHDAGVKPQKRPLLSPTDSGSDADEREGKRPRICDCTEADSECDCANTT
jgi:ankyrin repeat protein